MLERTGVAKYVTNVESRDQYGENTWFRKLACSFVEKVVSEGKWFAFGKVAHENQVDILSIKNDKQVKFGSMLEEGWFDYNEYRTRLYKYMLHDFLCYIEIPVVKRTQDLNGAKNSYNKMVATSNIAVVAEFMGISVEEADQKYGGRLLYNEVDTGESTYPYVKLYTSKDGERKVTRPKSDLDLEQSGLRIIPMFALKQGVDLLYKILSNDTYDVTFLKDSGQHRVINTTFSKEKIEEIYGSGEFLTKNLQAIFDGDFWSNPTMERGYIRVFEMGSSIYNNPTRSINFARIIGFEKEEPDLSYMYIDMDNVIEFFKDCLFSRKWSDEEIEELVDNLDEFEVGKSRELAGVRIKSVNQLEMWADEQELALSTVFVRQLAMFMIAFPSHFNGYTGAPQVLDNVSTRNNDESGLIPTDLDLDMPFV